LRGPVCTYEKTAIAAEYSKLLGLEEVEAFLLLARLPISECKRYQKPRFCVVRSSDPLIRIRSRSFSSDPSQGPKPSVHLLLDPVLGPKPFILFGSATGLEAVRSFSLVPHQSQSRPSFSLGSATGSGAVSQSGPRIETW